MASVFDIFGSINLETGAFDGALQRSVGRLKAADAALDSTIARSNKLGDTSATVARRYEKLSEQIQAQRNKLLDNALAFEKGEISSKKFAQITASVEKATAGLVSKLKDAKARLDELDATGLTHFQQQIAGAVDNANSKLESFRQQLLATQSVSGGSTDLFGRLSGFQKTQLSFQANDIITGLASGQNPMQILAQQGGQVVQIFQQTKSTQEGIVKATQEAAIAQKVFAAESDVAAKAIAQTSATTTVLGYSWVALGATVAGVGIALLAIHTAVKDIEKAAKLRLEIETQITGELNKQRIAIVEFEKERKAAQGERDFGRFLGSGGTFFLDKARRDRQSELANLQKYVDNETSVRGAALAAGQSGDDKFREKFLTQGLDEPKKRIEALREEIKKLDETIDNTQSSIKSTVTGYSGVIDVAMAHAAAAREADAKAAIESAKKVEEHKKKILDESIKKAKEFAERVKQAPDVIRGVFSSTTDNPFTKIFLDGENAVNKMLEATKGLGSELQNTLRNLLNTQTQVNALRRSMDNALKSLDLRRDAGVFIQNGLSNVWGSDYLQKQLEAIGATSPLMGFREGDRAYNPLTKQIGELLKPPTIALDNARQAEIDKQIIKLTEPFINDPDKLTYAQRKLASDARLREAERTGKEEEEDKKIRKELLDVLKTLNGNKALSILIDDPNGRTSNGGTSANVEARYKQ